MRRRKLILAVLSFSFFLSLEIPRAQHVQILSDQQWIELGIDLLRKGIQEEDTMKINMALAPEVSVNGEKAVASSQIAQRFQTIFSGSANRTMRLAKPAFSRPDSPRHNSEFWDFDILDPKITIDGDTAVVECELVLWGAPPDGINKGPGRKVKERLVFVSLVRAESSGMSGEISEQPNSHTLNGLKGLSNSRRPWKLCALNNASQFLQSEIKNSPNNINTSEEIKK